MKFKFIQKFKKINTHEYMILGESRSQAIYVTFNLLTKQFQSKSCATPGYKQNISYSSEKAFFHPDADQNAPFTLVTVDDLMIFDPQSQKALNSARYSCVFSHLASRPEGSDYLITMTPGNKVLFIGKMQKKKPGSDFEFSLLETFNLTSLFLNTEALTLSERTKT